MTEGAIREVGQVAGVALLTVALDAVDRELVRLLSDAERARAASYAHERDRARFVAGRAALRTVLARHTGDAPAALNLCLGPRGKPFLPGGPAFSISRSGALALVAVGGTREVGVDVERVREIPEAAGIAARLLDERERAEWRAAGGGSAAAFLRIWARKEALLKALGLGLAGAHGRPSQEAAEVHDVDLVPDHVAALAIAR